jgi:multidrug resistance efflux pump
VADVAPDVSGLVTKVYVTDNMWVRQGQPLFVIDAARYQLALQQAEATYQQDVAAAERAAAAITQARAGEAQARTGVLAQQTLLVEARREDDRNHRLGGLVSTESAQQGASKVAQLEAAVAQAQAAQGQATAGIAEAKAALDQARAMVVQARAASGTAKLNLQRTAVVAPVDGFAANVQLDPGCVKTTKQLRLLATSFGGRDETFRRGGRPPAVAVVAGLAGRLRDRGQPGSGGRSVHRRAGPGRAWV